MSRDSLFRLTWLAVTVALFLSAVREAFVWGARHRDILTCAQPNFQFGAVESRETIVHSFEVKNNSNHPIEITAAPGCSACIEITLDRNRLAAYESARVQCELDLRRFKGKVRKSILVQSANDTDAPGGKLALRIEGEAIASIAPAPAEISLKQAEVRPERIVEINLQSQRPDEQFKIMEVVPATKNWVAEAIAASEPSCRQSCKLRCVDPAPCKSYVKIKTDADWASEVIVPLRVF